MTHPDQGGGDEIASLAQRAIARALDLMTIAIVTLAVFAPQLTTADADNDISGWTQLAVFVIWVVYEGGTTAYLGCSMGKMATGCRLVDRRTGAKPGIARSVVRAAVVPGLLPFLGPFALLAYPTALLDRAERRGLLDRLAGTAVVRATR